GLGDGRAIHGDERRAGADAGTVDRLGDQTLAGSRLAEEEDGRRAPGGLGLASEHAGDLLAQGDDSWAPAEKLGEGRRHGAILLGSSPFARGPHARTDETAESSPANRRSIGSSVCRKCAS